jgi:hypothetical protein
MSKTYRVCVYELHTASYLIKAESAAQAHELYMSGEDDEPEGNSEFVQADFRYTLDELDQECPGILEGIQALKPETPADTETCVFFIKEVAT